MSNEGPIDIEPVSAKTRLGVEETAAIRKAAMAVIRDAVALVLENSDENDFDDNPNRITCRGCGWDSSKDKPSPNGDRKHPWHKPDCELAAARRLLEGFVDSA